MPVTHETLDKAEQEILLAGAPPKDIIEALCVIDRYRKMLEASQRHMAWASGRKGDGIAKIEGLSDTLTGLLRRFAACGVVLHAEFGPELHRHVSALRRKLKTLAPEAEISTLQGEGYEMTRGFDAVYRILHQGAIPATRAPGFTPKQTWILRLLVSRGSIHVDQAKCLQRHMSNLRKKLPRGVTIQTHPGEGLYTLERGKEILTRLLDGGDALTRSAA